MPSNFLSDLETKDGDAVDASQVLKSKTVALYFSSSFLSDLETKNGDAVDASQVLKNKTVALYFSSSWCPACKTFTPLLSVLHEDAQEEGLDFEVVYVSSDNSAEECNQYMKEKHGDWLRVPFDKTAEYKTQFGVFAGKEQSLFSSTKRRSGIPTLVIVNQEGKELDILDCDDAGVIKEIESKATGFLTRWDSMKW
ncbi:unnamed protein product [Cylindrotheca closterium]|uniref:Thioredoxin domain-containing protein n=1 Tax=Cylindrotheca closterium TaxID=2856 RepID=A0AAD2FL37_9STRA|nr:unnamed protein product [Cylindrotheca closterium]